MKKIKEALDEPDVDFFALISKQDLKKNFEYFVKVLDNVLLDERKQVFFKLLHCIIHMQRRKIVALKYLHTILAIRFRKFIFRIYDRLFKRLIEKLSSLFEYEIHKRLDLKSFQWIYKKIDRIWKCSENELLNGQIIVPYCLDIYIPWGKSHIQDFYIKYFYQYTGCFLTLNDFVCE